MSTTDSEQVTPTVEAKLSKEEVKALRDKRDQLSASIKQTVLDSDADLPEEGSARQLRSKHVQLTAEAETAKQQTERLTEAKLQVEPLAQECQGLEKELATTRESLSEFYQPLGVAAFAAQLAGQIKDFSALADRLALHKKVIQLRQESEALTPSAEAKTLEKVKANTQQLAAAGKIKIEEIKIGKLDKQIGQQLIEEQQEDTVRCEGTSAILDQISERRAEISEKEGKVAESTASFASSRDVVTKKLALSPFETVADLNTQIKESNTLTADAQKQLALLERELPDRLMADEDLRSSDSELGQQVQELAEIQAQLKTAGSALDNVKEGLGQFATKIKDAWSGLSTRGKAITLGVIALFVLGVVMMTEPENSVNSGGTGGSNESDETSTQLSKDAQYRNGEAEGRMHGYQVMGGFSRGNRRALAKQFGQFFQIHITNERNNIARYGLEHPQSVEYMQFNVGLKAGYVDVIGGPNLITGQFPGGTQLSLDELTEFLNLMPDY